MLGKVTKLTTPAAVVVSGGNIDEGRLAELVEGLEARVGR